MPHWRDHSTISVIAIRAALLAVLNCPYHLQLLSKTHNKYTLKSASFLTLMSQSLSLTDKIKALISQNL
eukprot:c42513_g1_i1 orf=120-326(-)